MIPIRAAAFASLLLPVVIAYQGATTQKPDPREAAYRANNIGVAYLEQYDFDAAAASFTRALALAPELGLARLNLGIALVYGGKPDAAREELVRARQLMPDRPHPDYVLGLIARAANDTEAAVSAFTSAQQLDRTDAGIAINLGQLYLQQRKYAEAIAAFRTAAAAEPYNATATYGLATALIRSGAADEGKSTMALFEKLRESSYATTFSQNYLEQGRFAEAVASTGLEAELLDERVPDVAFSDQTQSWVADAASRQGGGTVTLADLDGDGDLDLATSSAPTLRVLRNDSGKLLDVTPTAFETPPGAPIAGIVAADGDNDGDRDLLLFGAGGPAQLYRQVQPGRFAPATDAGLPAMHSVSSAAWLDADHDGDLDLVLAGLDGQKAPAVLLARNNGDGRFTDVTATAGTRTTSAIVAAVPTDFDNRRDIDIFVLPAAAAPLLFRNLRDGSFRDVAAEVGLTFDQGFASAAIGDVNKDGYIDFFLGRRDRPGALAVSDGRGRFTAADAPAASTAALASQFVDYDNDGLLDLFTATPQGPRLLRNLGARWADVTARAFPAATTAAAEGQVSMASGALDGDGDVDVVTRSRAGLMIWRNDGGSSTRSVAVRLTSRASNRSAVGTKIEIRAGSLRQRMETYAATPAPAPADVAFGLGNRQGADVVRVLWPSGILQAETAAGDQPTAGLSGIVKVEELDRKPSSCPYLFTWNGSRFEFITDFLGGGEIGYWLAPGLRNTPDADEYIRIDDTRLQPRDGRYEIRVTNELEEAVFLDRTQLVAIDHPADVSVHPNEGLRSSAGAFTLYAIRGAHTPAAVVDGHGHDVRDRIRDLDRRYPDDFPLERIRGYAGEHSLTIALPPASSARRALLLTGWTDYAFSGDNVAAHQLGLRMVPPSLQVAGADGVWRTAITEIGFPVGRPQTIVVDLAAIPAAATHVRIVTTMRIYWDRIQVGTIDDGAAIAVTRLEPGTSDLRWRGFSARVSPDGREPFAFAYDRVTPESPWKLLTGLYTREGDVRELLAATDDQFVIGRPGDEIALSFDATRTPPPASGRARTFLLYADGFSKEMDLNSASPDELGPLPFHGMRQYPYAAADAPRWSEAHRAYVARFNTRAVKRSLPPLELSGPERFPASRAAGQRP